MLGIMKNISVMTRKEFSDPVSVFVDKKLGNLS